MDHANQTYWSGIMRIQFLRRSPVRYLENLDAYECLASASAPLSKLIENWTIRPFVTLAGTDQAT